MIPYAIIIDDIMILVTYALKYESWIITKCANKNQKLKKLGKIWMQVRLQRATYLFEYDRD